MHLLMAHGIWDRGSIFRRMADYLEARGHRCYCPDMIPANGSKGLEDLAVKMRAFIEAEIPEKTALALVGFSMGSLVARHYLQHLGGAERVSYFFSIAGPHHGTLCAHLYPGKAARDMRFGSPFLRALNEDLCKLDGIECHSYWTPFDLMILPCRSSRVSWARNHRIPAAFHHRMVVQQAVFEHMANVLEPGDQRLDAKS